MIKRFPRLFYDDHNDRDLASPPPVNESVRYVWIDTAHPDFAELLEDARYYDHQYGPDGARFIVRAAKRFLKAAQC